ncbi:fungal specific transcription factor domain-containing protein [Colletotrichum costaricense]|uniref:Fungal specific transcription factor domain-containing protein n=1 Tax=Colletotrichum costaricense TaxID=1209916 RepID=A0AAJ0DU59_9PEZI|nr:fungal specific transcription factor domain-containing protein [Colletotrichum costaricense]KAK1512491.1 fungal specific transcription factor domain-containing protein [Colletotrichum costaricense]
MATRANPPKKVRLACRRCRTRRIKVRLSHNPRPALRLQSDQIPRWGLVLLAWTMTGTIAALLRLKLFASAARARIQWLEEIIKQRLPDVDIAGGPQIDAFPDPKGSGVVGGGDYDEDNISTSSPRSGRGCSQPVPVGGTIVLGSQRSGSLKRTAEAAGSNDHDEEFPDRAHSVARNLGMLSLNSDSDQKHYLGSSSGVLFTNLIGASPSSAGSTPVALIDDVQAQGPASEWHDSTIPSNVSQEYNRALHVCLRQELPRKEDAIKLVHTYIRWIHPDYPVLEATSLLSAIEALYATFECSLEEDPLPNGWPSSVQAFRWNGWQVTPSDQGMQAVPMPVVAFTLFMVFNIAAIMKIRSRIYEFPPERFYRNTNSLNTIPSSFSEAVLRYARHQFELDRLISDVKQQLYHLPGDSSWFPMPRNPTDQQGRIKQELVNWWREVSEESFDFPGVDNRQRRIWKLKLKIKYHTTMVMLYQPSQVIRNPPPESLQICFNNASSILQDYQMLHDMQGLHHGWRTVQNIFAAGATLIYSFWTCPIIRQSASTADLSKSLRACSGLLAVGGEWWPSVKRGQRSFGAIVDLTVRKLYTGNMPSKNPRLFMPLSAEDGETAIENSEGAPVYDATGQQSDLSHIALNGADAPWHQMAGASMELPNAHDPVHWQGVYPAPPFHSTTNDYVPEIETFLADFDKSEFSWSFPLTSISDPYDIANFPNPGYR